MDMITEAEGGYIVETPQVAYTYKTEDNIRDFDKYKKEGDLSLDWNDTHNFIGDYIVHAYGNNNDLPSILKEIVQRNYIAPGLLRKKGQLLWGSGPALYKEEFDGGMKKRMWQDDAEITAWLKSFAHEELLLRLIEDYQYVQGCMTKFELKRSSLLGNNFIKKLEHIQPDKGRLASRRDASGRKPTHIITNDWSFNSVRSLTDYKVYPLLDPVNPFAKPNSVLYSNLYSFCSDYYSVPEIYGSLEWLNRSTAVPLIFKAMSKNSINLKFHITSPQKFWDDKREQIKENCIKAGKEFKEQYLKDFERKFLKGIADVLSGDENSGKYLHTVNTLYVDGHNLLEMGWKVEVIDQKVKDFVDSQIQISQRADYALSAGIGLNPALGGVSDSGKANGGSEQYYALINFLNTGVDIPEFIICKPFNYAIQANWPNKGLKLGFHHNIPEKQENISPDQRMKNNVQE
jgi:hypothetical protein